jgi:peptide/nickel transport system substrate-binding protein
VLRPAASAHRRTPPPRRRAARPTLLAAAAAVLAAAAATPAAATPAAATSAAASPPRAGWVLSIATPTSSTPTWAYPFASGDELTTANVQRFQQLMYRPLYFFGGSGSVEFDEPLSLATAPRYTSGDTVVSFTIKPGLRWSDGEGVTAEGVVEWLNLDTSYPGMWGDYLAPLPTGVPLGLPDDLRAVTVTGQTVTLTLAAPVNPTWFTYSELSQLTPLPASWDLYEPARPRVPLTGPSSITGNHGDFTSATAVAGCYGDRWVGTGTTGVSNTYVDPSGTRTVVPAAGVAQAIKCVDAVTLLRSLSADTADYTAAGTDVAATWGRADGPWRLASYNAATGAVAMAPNRAVGASGQHAAATLLRFVPCGSAAACVGLLHRGVVDQGTLPLGDAPPVRSFVEGPSRNPLRAAGYRETVVAPWATSYFPYNFRSARGAGGRAGHVFAQAYFRLAFQSLVDQPTAIADQFHGYGVDTTGPVPSTPSTGFATSTGNPAPFSVARARGLLAAHGWHVAPGHLTVCVVASRCGTGIAKGTPLRFTLEYAPAPGSGALARLARDAAAAGIQVTLVEVPAARVLADVGGSSRNWDLASWGGGWLYAPGYFPSGEWTFAAGSPWNVGAYGDPRATALVLATLAQPSQLRAYDSYLAAQLPVVWQPSAVTLVESRTTLRDVAISPIGSLTPEAWRR